VFLVGLEFLDVDFDFSIFLDDHGLLVSEFEVEDFLFVFELVPPLHELKVLLSFELDILAEVVVYFFEVGVVLATDFFVVDLHFVELILELLDLRVLLFGFHFEDLDLGDELFPFVDELHIFGVHLVLLLDVLVDHVCVGEDLFVLELVVRGEPVDGDGLLVYYGFALGDPDVQFVVAARQPDLPLLLLLLQSPVGLPQLLELLVEPVDLIVELDDRGFPLVQFLVGVL
jgi:hypothetical protein